MSKKIPDNQTNNDGYKIRIGSSEYNNGGSGSGFSERRKKRSKRSKRRKNSDTSNSEQQTTKSKDNTPVDETKPKKKGLRIGHILHPDE